MRPAARTTLLTGLLLTTIVVVLGVAVAGITWWLRAGLREQILHREGESLYAVTIMQRALETESLGEMGLTGDDEQLALLALQTSRLRGVLGVQVFDRGGRPLAPSSAIIQIPPPNPEEWQILRALKPVVRFSAHASLEKSYGWENEPGQPIPLLEISVPLHQPEATAIEGAAHFVIEGKMIAREFELLDQHLVRQAGFVWLLAAITVVTGLGWVLRRLARANASLQARTEDLVRANRELGLAAKTSALGAITAHLVHGLRNPIAGLESYIEEQRDAAFPVRSGAWSEATATARRMKMMIDEVVSLMQEEQSGARYELSGREVLALVASRISAIAGEKKVQLALESEGDGRLTNHQAGLVAAILTNLAQNACEASPPDAGKVRLAAKSVTGGGMEFFVEDNGVGLSAESRSRLFRAGQSAKPGGAGIGLAISRQLAIHLGGTLELVTSGSTGTSFRLCVPPSSR